MSRQAQQRGASSAARSSDQDDICPVCKSSRYLNKSMRFLVNPECYHKMCESCVDRIFSHGPNKCPIAGCNRTLRKHRFREQTFEDIQVEREVDIRKRIANVFNRREDEFDTLFDYNNYLNDVEDITFNLVNKIDLEETERKLASYSEQNSGSITQNAALASQEAQDFTAFQAAEKEQARLRREAARREEEEERRARAEGRQDMINRLATGMGGSEHVAEEGSRVTLKKRMDRQQAVERHRQLQESADTQTSSNGSGGYVIKGLRTRKAPEPEKPFDAFGGLLVDQKYYVPQDHYEWHWLNDLRGDVPIVAGGYSLQEFQSRALCEAFSGLGVFIGDDETHTNGHVGTVGAAAVAAAPAGIGVKDIKMEDPF